MPDDAKKQMLYQSLDKYEASLDLDQVAEALQVSRRTVDRLTEGDTPKLEWFPVETDETTSRRTKRVMKGTLVNYMLNQHMTPTARQANG